MDNQSTEYVYTCGICEIICDKDEVSTHQCLEGYSNYTTDENLYFYPVLDDGVTIIRKRLIQGTEAIASVPFHNNIENIQPINNSLSHQKNAKEKLSSEEEEILLLEVQCREPLWNFKLPLVQRNSKITKALWEEVSKALNGKLSAAGCKSKFKNLHVTYRRLINAEKLPSGSASKKNLNKWKHYNSMAFLRDSCLQKNTISNINDGENSNSNICENNKDSQDTSTSGDDHIRKNTSEHNPLKHIVDTLNQLLSNVGLPPPPEEDRINAFLKLFGYNLRKLSPEKQDEWIQRYLQQSYEMLKDNA